MRNKRTLIIVVILLVAISSIAYAASLGTLYSWNDNTTDEIVKNNIHFDVYVDNSLDPSFITTINSVMSHAVSQWSGAGMDVSIKSNSSGTEVKAYGGSYVLLKTVFSSLGSSNTGLASYGYRSRTNVGTYEVYNNPGRIVTRYDHVSGFIQMCVVNKGRTTAQYKKTATHELGHVLGWKGHSSNSSDIMYSYGSSITNLTSRDEDHLLQLY